MRIVSGGCDTLLVLWWSAEEGEVEDGNGNGDGAGVESEVNAILSQVVDEDMRRPVDSVIRVTVEDGCGCGFVGEVSWIRQTCDVCVSMSQYGQAHGSFPRKEAMLSVA